MAGAPADYIDVATRIKEFREKFPTGSLSRVAPDGTLVSLDFREVGGKMWVIYTAFAYRTPDDPQPGVGTAWEPIPGPTNFTRDSEVQNAETAAWGRALVAVLAADTKLGVASGDEIRARQDQAAEGPGQQIYKPPPAGWKDRIKASGTLEDLNTIYNEANGGQWATPAVIDALGNRKRELQSA